jgi:serine/threonine-protein kinase
MICAMTAGSDHKSYAARFEADYPFGQEVLQLFKAAGARTTRLSPVRQGAPTHSWALHVRLPRELEDHFSITRQFLVYCVCTKDLQPRDVSRVQALIRDADGEVEADFSMLISSDPLSKTKLTEWSAERSAGGITIVPLSRSKLELLLNGKKRSHGLSHVIEEWVSERNLYDERSPVTGERFHGRTAVLRDLDRHLAKGGGDIGLFGLRRIGKTSVLLELVDRLNQRDAIVPVFIDLEGTNGAAHAAHRIGQELARAIAAHGRLTERQAVAALQMPSDWSTVEPRLLIARVGDALRDALTSGVLKERRLILMLDEAESLLPSPQKPAEFALDLFRALRGVSQETGRLNLVLAGVNATPTESPFLGDQDNPLFGSLAVHYLGPLEPEECEEMIRKIGRRMQVRWDGRAAAALTEHVGAHPLLARLAASDLVTRYPERPLRPNLEHADSVLESFSERQSSVFEQMIQSLRRYYPGELEVLQVVADGDQVFATELLDDDPALINHLAGYGVLNSEHLSISIPAFRKWLRLKGRTSDPQGAF